MIPISEVGTGAEALAPRPASLDGAVIGLYANVKINGDKFALELRTGKMVQVDATSAAKAEKLATLSEGLAVSAEGTVDKAGAMHAAMVNRIKSARTMWPEDR